MFCSWSVSGGSSLGRGHSQHQATATKTAFTRIAYHQDYTYRKSQTQTAGLYYLHQLAFLEWISQSHGVFIV